MPVPSGAARDPMATLSSVSCTKAICEAAGFFAARSGAVLAMTIRQTGDRWGKATSARRPANARKTAGQNAALAAVACGPAARCAAAGSYLDTTGRQQAMVSTRP